MNRRITALALLMCVVALTVVHAQTTQPTDADRLAQTAKDFGMTSEQMEKFIRKEMGDPLVIDKDLVVGVHRDNAGHVKTVKISTPKRNLEFNTEPKERPAMQYLGGEVAPNAAFASATDIDGDARVDVFMFRAAIDAPSSTILLRIGDRFEPATALGDKKFRVTSSGQVVAFDAARHEWAQHCEPTTAYPAWLEV